MKRFIRKIQSCLQDNRGFTLSELLIAVAMLGIVSTPLLHSFLTSANTEVKARKMGEATIAAQNIMECIKANDFETVVPLDVESLENLFGADSANYYKDANYHTADASQIRPVLDDGTNPSDYHIKVNGISAGGQNCYATIDLNANSDQGNIININQATISQYSSMDVVFQVPGVPSPVEHETIGTREIVLNVDADKAKLQYIESISSYEPVTGTKTKDIITTTTYDKECAITSETSSIYLFFNPNYEDRDVIYINSTNLNKFDLFLIARGDTTDPSYSCTVMNGASNITVYTNTIGNSIVTTEQRERIYEVTIKIFDQNTDEVLCTLSGTKLK